MAVNRIDVTIDRVRLDGVPKADVPTLIAAMQRALEHSLARQAGPQTWTSAEVPELRADGVRTGVGPSATGRAFGQAIASALNGGMAR